MNLQLQDKKFSKLPLMLGLANPNRQSPIKTSGTGSGGSEHGICRIFACKLQTRKIQPARLGVSGFSQDGKKNVHQSLLFAFIKIMRHRNHALFCSIIKFFSVSPAKAGIHCPKNGFLSSRNDRLFARIRLCTEKPGFFLQLESRPI